MSDLSPAPFGNQGKCRPWRPEFWPTCYGNISHDGIRSNATVQELCRSLCLNGSTFLSAITMPTMTMSRSFTDMLKRSGFDLRNSSIRAKPSNQARLDRGQVKDETIKRLLRMKMSWASTVVVIIGKDTHKRPWVDWEIRKSQRTREAHRRRLHMGRN